MSLSAAAGREPGDRPHHSLPRTSPARVTIARSMSTSSTINLKSR